MQPALTAPQHGTRLDRLPYWLVRSLSAEELRRYNAGQPRDPGGEGGGQWISAGGGASSGLKDTLKLAGKIKLEPDEQLLGSAKVDAAAGGVRMALTDRGGNRLLRFGAGAEGYGQRDREEGIPAWDGNPSRPPLSEADRQRLSAEADALDDEYEAASPDRQSEITARQDEIREELVGGEQGFNGTAQIDEFAMRRLADRIRPAIAEAVEQQRAEDAAWEEIEALEANGNPDPARMARLRQIVDRTDYITFTQGIVSGSAWGDVAFSVELDDPSVGPYLRMGVQPKGAPDDWGSDQDWQATLDAAETRKFLRLLDKFAEASATRSRDAEGATMPTRAFQPEEHPRAPSGTDAGGQFAKAAAAAKKSAGTALKSRRPRKSAGRPPRKDDDGTLAYDPAMKSLPRQKRSGVMDMCIRAFGFEVEERSRTSDGRTLEGYAAVFNAPTRIAAIGGDFDEVITHGAFTRSIRQRMPVLQFEHGRDPRVGAVPIGSIDDLSEDSQGLHVRATLFDNPVVEPVRQAIAGRAIKGMSFRFNVVDGGEAWQRRSGDVDLRTVGDADVHELGPVVFPAYDSTTVSVRSLLAQLGPEEHLTLLRELAHDLRSIDHPGVGPSARSSGGAGLDREQVREQPRLSIRQRLDQGALQARGILK